MNNRRNFLTRLLAIPTLLSAQSIIRSSFLPFLSPQSAYPKVLIVTRSRIGDSRRSSIYANELAEARTIEFVERCEKAGIFKCVYTETNDSFQWIYSFNNELAYMTWYQHFYNGQTLSDAIYIRLLNTMSSFDQEVHIEVV